MRGEAAMGHTVCVREREGVCERERVCVREGVCVSARGCVCECE